jgi:hypothetical protein
VLDNFFIASAESFEQEITLFDQLMKNYLLITVLVHKITGSNEVQEFHLMCVFHLLNSELYIKIIFVRELKLSSMV